MLRHNVSMKILIYYITIHYTYHMIDAKIYRMLAHIYNNCLDLAFQATLRYLRILFL